LFGILAASLGAQASEVVGAYQSFLIVIFSLASIWLTRQFLLNETPRLRDAFYKGMYPLIPFILVLFVVALQLLPALFGNFLYSVVTQQGLAVTAIERLIWLILLLLLVALSLYMIISSLFALYIVTLPDMTPLKALRSARELVLHRRLKILVRIVAMPLILVLLAVLIFVPLLIFATPLAEPLFLLASSFALVVIHVYFYNVYRALL
jgi:hypothetical protein